MKLYELLNANRSAYELLSKESISVSIVGYIPLYDEYKKKVADGLKKTYIISVLSEKYGINERMVYNIIKKMSKEVAV